MEAYIDRSALLRAIMDNKTITTLFQPIVDLRSAEIIGYEALSRGPQGNPLYSPLELIDQAEKDGQLLRLEALFHEKAISNAHAQGLRELLFLNVDPNVLIDPIFSALYSPDSWAKRDIPSEKIVFEITERSVVEKFGAFETVLHSYLDRGYKTAIDDMGVGYSNMAMISRIKPHFIKIDMHLVHGVDTDSFKQAIIKSFVWLSNLTNAKIIAEGIERSEEMHTLISLGVHAGQGYLLGRPSERLVPISEAIRGEILDANNSAAMAHSFAVKSIGEICKPVRAFEADRTCMEIKQALQREKIEGACILRRGHIVGLIMRDKLNFHMSAQYGFALHANRPISSLTDSGCLIVDCFTPIGTVCELALSRPDERIYDNIIVTRNFKYCGMVSVLSLLRYSSDIERSFALELNPLTGLPGNAQINKVLLDVIGKKDACCVVYFDLDNFKIYNDAYGFRQGDEIIKATKEIIARALGHSAAFSSFLGHIGGDDFIAVLHVGKQDCETLCAQVIRDFDREIPSFFSAEDRARGSLFGKVRGSAEKREFPLTSLSVAGLSGCMGAYESPDRLSFSLSALKAEVKELPGSNCVIRSI